MRDKDTTLKRLNQVYTKAREVERLLNACLEDIEDRLRWMEKEHKELIHRLEEINSTILEDTEEETLDRNPSSY